MILLLGAFARTGSAQRVSDTTAVIREFNEVMGFAVQPYLYYTSVTSLLTGPLMDRADTGALLHGVFYKNGDDLYYGNEQEESFWQDSLMININHRRKTIRVSKVDVASKKKMDLLPLKKMDAQKLLREHYTISRLPARGDTEYIVVRSQEGRQSLRIAGTEMLLSYTKKEHLPLLMQVTMRVRQQETGGVTEALRAKGFDVAKMTEEKEGAHFLVMDQTAAVRFNSIEMTKDKALEMPSWKEKISYDALQGSFSGKGECAGYEVVKTF